MDRWITVLLFVNVLLYGMSALRCYARQDVFERHEWMFDAAMASLFSVALAWWLGR